MVGRTPFHQPRGQGNSTMNPLVLVFGWRKIGKRGEWHPERGWLVSHVSARRTTLGGKRCPEAIRSLRRRAQRRMGAESLSLGMTASGCDNASSARRRNHRTVVVA